MPGNHGKICDGLHICRTAYVLGNTQAVAHHTLLCSGIQTRGSFHQVRRDTCHSGKFIKILFIEHIPQGVVVLCTHLYEHIIYKSLCKDDAHHGIKEGNVGTGPELQVYICKPGKRGSPWICNNQSRASVNGMDNPPGHLRVRFRCI